MALLCLPLEVQKGLGLISEGLIDAFLEIYLGFLEMKYNFPWWLIGLRSTDAAGINPLPVLAASLIK